jgi:hypothetical protein
MKKHFQLTRAGFCRFWSFLPSEDLVSASFEAFFNGRIGHITRILMFLTLHMLHNNQTLVVYNLSMDIYTREQLRIHHILHPIESQTPLWRSTFCLLLSHTPFWLNRRQNVPPECVLSCFLVCESWDMKMPKTKAYDMWIRSLSLEITHAFIRSCIYIFLQILWRWKPLKRASQLWREAHWIPHPKHISTGGERKTKQPTSTHFNTWESMSSSVNFLSIICYLVECYTQTGSLSSNSLQMATSNHLRSED